MEGGNGNVTDGRVCFSPVAKTERAIGAGFSTVAFYDAHGAAKNK